MSKKEETRNELKGIAPELLKIGKTSFSVPEGYFEQLSDVVLKKVQVAEKDEVHKANLSLGFEEWVTQIRLFFKVPYALATIGMMVLLVSVFSLMPSREKAAVSIASNNIVLEQEEIAQYVEENIEDFEEVLILSNLKLSEEAYLEILLEEAALEELF